MGYSSRSIGESYRIFQDPENEILGDEETLEMYRQIVNVHQALDSQKKDEEINLPSMDEEWEN